MAETSDERAARSAAAARRGANAELPRRFYKLAEVHARDGGFAIVLDGKPVRTPGRKLLMVPRNDIAETIASEWAAQAGTINPATMPMTRLVNSAIDGVANAERDVAAGIAKYAGSDLLCYRVSFPEGLVGAQAKHWDPVLAWIEADYGWRFVTSVGVVHVSQPEAVLKGVERLLTEFDAFGLAGMHSMTTLTGSVLLALAVARRHLSAEQAWAAAHVDEDWQISQWGQDAEAQARRAFRWRDMLAAAMLVA